MLSKRCDWLLWRETKGNWAKKIVKRYIQKDTVVLKRMRCSSLVNQNQKHIFYFKEHLRLFKLYYFLKQQPSLPSLNTLSTEHFVSGWGRYCSKALQQSPALCPALRQGVVLWPSIVPRHRLVLNLATRCHCLQITQVLDLWLTPVRHLLAPTWCQSSKLFYRYSQTITVHTARCSHCCDCLLRSYSWIKT